MFGSDTIIVRWRTGLSRPKKLDQLFLRAIGKMLQIEIIIR